MSKIVPCFGQVIKRREAAQRDAEFYVQFEMAKIPNMRKAAKYIDDKEAKENQRILAARVKALKRKRQRRGLGRVAMRRQLYTRGHFRKHSRLLTNSCGERRLRKLTQDSIN